MLPNRAEHLSARLQAPNLNTENWRRAHSLEDNFITILTRLLSINLFVNYYTRFYIIHFENYNKKVLFW